VTTMTQEQPVILLGAGLAGSLLACYLAKHGLHVEVYERRTDMRKDTESSVGRSINLALSKRGIEALARVGFKEEVMKMAIPMKGRTMHSVDGNLTFQPYSKDEKSYINSISRGDLNCRLMTLSEQNPNVKYFFEHKVTHLDLHNETVTVEDIKTGHTKTVKGQTILATDGAFSIARGLMMKTPRFNFSQEYLPTGYKELHIPPGPDGKHQIDTHSLHIWPRGHLMMIALPNQDGSFTVTCFFPFDGPDGFDVLDKYDDEKILGFFKEKFPDIVPLCPTLIQDFRHNPTSSLVTIKCFPWSIGGKVCLLGDSSHAIVPFFGQGMNAAFEDCLVFEEIYLKNISQGWPAVFAEFQKDRKPNTDAIAQMAEENHYEMRDKVGDKTFLWKKKVERVLGNKYPDRFLSRYELVSFSRMPYKDTLERGAANDRVISELIEGVEQDNIEGIDMDKAAKLVEKYLTVLHLDE